MRTTLIYTLISFIVSFILVYFGVNAQDIEIKASAPTVVTLGQAFNYTISGNFDGKVNLPQMDGVRVAGGPSTFVSQQSTYVNGKLQMVRQVSYSYTLVAEREGDITIPPARITSGRKEYLSNEIKIQVVKGTQQATPGTEQSPESSEGKSESIFVQLTPTRKNVFLGEQLLLTSKIYTQEPLQIADIKEPALEGFWKEELKADESSGRDTYNGQNYLSLVFGRYLLTAQKPGEIRINPVEVNCLVQKKVKSGRSSSPFSDPFFNDPFFNDSFFDRIQTVRESFSSNALTITVKPLPPGSPPGFNGAVGNFRLKAEIDKDQLKVNDALTLKLIISGQGNLMLIKQLKVDFPPDLEVFDPKTIPNYKNTTEGTSGSLTFEYLIIPRHAGSYRISPVVFSYFDPMAKKYHSLQTKEFNFSVEKSSDQDESFITSPGVVGPQGRSDGIQGQNVISLANDIQFIKLTPPALRKTGVTLFGSVIFNLTFLIVIILFIAIIIFKKERIRRNADLNAVRNRKARRIARRKLALAHKLMKVNEEGFYEEVLKALWGYLSDKLGIDAADLSRDVITDKLRSLSVPTDVLDELWHVIDDCEFARYGTGFIGDKQVIYEKVMKLISDLQESIN